MQLAEFADKQKRDRFQSDVIYYVRLKSIQS